MCCAILLFNKQLTDSCKNIFAQVVPRVKCGMPMKTCKSCICKQLKAKRAMRFDRNAINYRLPVTEVNSTIFYFS